jgi:acyl-CoA thioester hydrolase
MTVQWHRYQTRVRYAEIDRMGLVYHSRYIEWFEAARTEMLRDRGLAYNDLEAKGISLPVVEVKARFLKPVRYDDLVTVQTCVEKISRIKLHLSYQVFDESHDLRAEGYTIHCFTNRQGRPQRVGQSLVNLIRGSQE